jgi:hypothetical protein
MRPKLRIRRRRSSSRRSRVRTANAPGAWGRVVTTFLLAVILVTGPLILGADRLWIELPLLAAVALLLVVQGLRLVAVPLPGVLRQADAIDLSAILFVIYAAIRWMTSPSEYFSRIEVMEVAACAGVFFTCRHGMTNRRQCIALLCLLVVLGVGEAAFGYYLSNHSDWFPFGSTERMQLYYAPLWMGTYESPNHYVSLLVMAIGAALALGCFSKLAWPIRIVLIYFAVMMVFGVIYSGSRGGWIALGASIAALVTMGIRNGTMRWWVPVTGALVLVAIIGVMFSISPVVHDRLAATHGLIAGGKLQADGRVLQTKSAYRIARDYRWFGTGPGTYIFVHPHYQGGAEYFRPEPIQDDYLNCLDDYGLVGLGIALFFVAAVTLKFFRPLVVDHRWQDRVMVATGFAAWAALLVHSIVDFNLHIPANARWLFSLTGLALGRIHEDKKVHWSTISLALLGRWLGGGVIALSLIYGFEVARTAWSDKVYEAAFSRSDEVPFSESITDAETALRYDPGNAQAWTFLGDIHRYQAALQKDLEARHAEGQKALGAYQKALQANALDDSVQVQMGTTLGLMQNFPEALSHFKLALSAQPYNGNFWCQLGNLYQGNGMLDKAEEAYLQGERCALGSAANTDAEKKLRSLPAMNGVPAPAEGINPLNAPP